MSDNIVVIAEVRSGKLKHATLEAISAGRKLAGSTGGKVIALAAGADLDAACQELGKVADRTVALQAEALADFSGDGHAEVLLPEIRSAAAAAVLMAHTAMAKDLMPRLAAGLETGLCTDVTDVRHEDGRFRATKPVYAGKAILELTAEKAPFAATLRPNNFEAASGGGSEETEKKSPDVAADSFLAVVKEVAASSTDRVPLQEASVVVSGGRGLKAPEHFELVEKLAAAFGPGVASVGASRAVVDAGWRPHREQVGQTGKVVAPTLYIAVGISGAIQHLAGMRTARTIVAINKDPEAPIFKVADYGIVGDAFEVIPKLTEAIEEAVGQK